ncbi:MAG: peptidylprolyl isomerase [Gammaproteobacteria bacterium]
MNRTLTLYVVALWLTALIPLTPNVAAPRVVEPLDRIVAVVNDDVITATELESRVRFLRKRLEENNTRLPPDDVLRKQVLEREILTRIELQIAERSGITITDPALNESLRQIARRNNMSLEQFRDVLVREGFDFEEFRENLREEMTISQLRRREVFDRVSVTEREIDDYIALHGSPGRQNREYHLGHILIALPEGASADQIAEARNRAEKIVRELREGADFAQMALSASAGQQALQGGDLGWRKAGQLPSLFAAQVTKMEPGDISDPVRSASGFHIVKLLETRGDERLLVTQTHARHILIRPDAVTTDEQARQRLELLRARLLEGDDFAELARANSQDLGSAAQGGDLGWTSPGRMVPRFEEVMNSLQAGEISEPFKTRFGWHIVQVLGRRQHDDTAEVQRSQVVAAIRKSKADENLELWLRRLREESYVELRLEEE